MADVLIRRCCTLNLVCSAGNKSLLSFSVSNTRSLSTFRKRRSSFSIDTSSGGEHFDTRGPRNEIDYASCREESERLRQLRNYYFARASQAYSKGQGNMAKRMSQRGWMVHSALQHATKLSVNDILNLSNSEYTVTKDNTGYTTLNLHGLRVKEAMSVVQEFLEENGELEGRLRIITGWGNNSYPRHPQLLPALKKLLTEQGRTYYELRPGVVEVIL